MFSLRNLQMLISKKESQISATKSTIVNLNQKISILAIYQVSMVQGLVNALEIAESKLETYLLELKELNWMLHTGQYKEAVKYKEDIEPTDEELKLADVNVIIIIEGL